MFECEICGKSLTAKKTLAQHISAIHEGNKLFKCDNCDYSCSQKGNLKTHVQSVHDGKNEGKKVVT